MAYENLFICRDKPQEWLSKITTYDISKFSRLDVLIGRHGVGVDLSGKYFAMIFRDAERTANFLEFFMCKLLRISDIFIERIHEGVNKAH